MVFDENASVSDSNTTWIATFHFPHWKLFVIEFWWKEQTWIISSSPVNAFSALPLSCRVGTILILFNQTTPTVTQVGSISFSFPLCASKLILSLDYSLLCDFFVDRNKRILNEYFFRQKFGKRARKSFLLNWRWTYFLFFDGPSHPKRDRKELFVYLFELLI